MYRFPQPFTLDPAGIGRCRLILPVAWVVSDPRVTRVGTPEELEAIKQKYATKGHLLEAERLIAAKARNMLRHYVENILPNGFKAQVVAVSRRATIRYYHALEFAPVISSEHNDGVDPQGEWSSRSKVDARIARFKKPLFADGPNTFGPDHTGGDKADPLAFLIVKSMLLTGFDAPVEQVMYLDRHIREAELLGHRPGESTLCPRRGREGLRYRRGLLRGGAAPEGRDPRAAGPAPPGGRCLHLQGHRGPRRHRGLCVAPEGREAAGGVSRQAQSLPRLAGPGPPAARGAALR